jgi:hypothetical protein
MNEFVYHYDKRSRNCVYFGVTDGTVTFHSAAHFTRAAPGQTDGTTTFGFECHSGQVVLATSVHHFGPAGSLAVILTKKIFKSKGPVFSFIHS